MKRNEQICISRYSCNFQLRSTGACNEGDGLKQMRLRTKRWHMWDMCGKRVECFSSDKSGQLKHVIADVGIGVGGHETTKVQRCNG